MRVVIVSRIFLPEPAAASQRLGALARALAAAGHQVEVLTVAEPTGAEVDLGDGVKIRRFPVLRDRSGYVRGIVQYLSFDVPLIFRLLFRRKPDLVIAEPPPTTGLVVRVISTLRRARYVYYAGDIWADALVGTDVSPLLRRAMAAVERIALGGAAAVLAVSPRTEQRIGELTPGVTVVLVPHGVDTRCFNDQRSHEPLEVDAIYTGMASERHGADVFIRALVHILRDRPDTTMTFLGYGSEWDRLIGLARELDVSHAVTFEPPVPAGEAAARIKTARVALASVAPGVGYDYAFPTKIYSALSTGTPVVYAGLGPAADLIDHTIEANLGWVSAHDPQAVAARFLEAMAAWDQWREHHELGSEQARIAQWTRDHRSIDAMAAQAVRELDKAISRTDGS